VLATSEEERASLAESRRMDGTFADLRAAAPGRGESSRRN
jgi:hypothetical protein